MADLATSADREASEKFQVYYAARTTIAEQTKIGDFSASVLTTGHWPSFPNTESVSLPPQFALATQVRERQLAIGIISVVKMHPHGRFSTSITATRRTTHADFSGV